MTRKRPLGVMSAAAALLVVVGLPEISAVPVVARSATTTSPNLRTAWGDPDLQSIWNQVFKLPPYRAIEATTLSFDAVSVRRIRQSGW
jgi:hypothetical protein